jgi:hypothetical protein
MMTFLWRPRRHLGIHNLSLTCQTTCLGEEKRHLWGLMSHRDRVWWWWSYWSFTHGTFRRNEDLEHEEEAWMSDMWPLEAYPYIPNSNDLLLVSKRLPKGVMSSCFRVFFCAKVKIRMNCLTLFCKGARLGLLTPNFVFYPSLCGQTFC